MTRRIPADSTGAATWLGTPLPARLRLVVARAIAVLALAATVVAASALPASADFVDDPLHGYCPGCADNGVNTPTSTNPLTIFGFSISPQSQTGNLLLEILVPNNEVPIPTNWSFTVTGTSSGTAKLYTPAGDTVPTAWTNPNQSLDQFLGISAKPSTPFGAYDCQQGNNKCADHYDPGLTGFYVYQLDLPNTTLPQTTSGNSADYASPLWSIAQALPVGTYIVGFLNVGTVSAPNWIAPAPSGAILETRNVPEPVSLVLLSTCLVGFGVAQRLRRKRRPVLGQLDA